ncbi:MAG TPA: cytochrome c [Chitinophagales bacterium]|nr:cytochrome c [Chitinophagales bacterium]
MKKFIVLMAAISGLLVLSQCWQHRSKAVTQDEGAKLFGDYCAGCHSITGRGGPSQIPGFNAPDLRKFKKSQAELEQIISNGYGKMPAFADSASTAEIAMIAQYVATDIEQH